MDAVDEEASGAHGRQTGQRHGQPVGIGQLIGGDSQFRETGQDLLKPRIFFLGGRKGVDAPDIPVFVLFEDRIGGAFEKQITIDGVCR